MQLNKDLDQYGGKVRVIYIDPPYNTKTRKSYNDKQEREEVKYNGLQPLVVEIGIGEYMWEDFGITQKHYDTWKKLILSGRPSIESFGILNFNGASYGKLSQVVYENGVIILFFPDMPSELKVYSDGRCEIPPGGDIMK